MTFEQRFVKLPVKFSSNTAAEDEMGLEPREPYDGFTYLDPDTIDEWMPTTDGEDGPECVKIFLRNGRAFWVHITPVGFLKLMNEWSQIARD